MLQGNTLLQFYLWIFRFPPGRWAICSNKPQVRCRQQKNDCDLCCWSTWASAAAELFVPTFCWHLIVAQSFYMYLLPAFVLHSTLVGVAVNTMQYVGINRRIFMSPEARFSHDFCPGFSCMSALPVIFLYTKLEFILASFCDLFLIVYF